MASLRETLRAWPPYLASLSQRPFDVPAAWVNHSPQSSADANVITGRSPFISFIVAKTMRSVYYAHCKGQPARTIFPAGQRTAGSEVVWHSCGQVLRMEAAQLALVRVGQLARATYGQL